MAEISIRIENINQIRAAFAKAPRVMTSNLDRAIKKSIFTVQRRSMQNTPVLTGRLRASHNSSFGTLKGILNVTAYYALFVHDGTRYMRARPFLLQAVESSDNEVQSNFREAVQDTLDDIARST